MINNKDESLKTSIKEFCSVCGYEKSTKHYGVFSCSSKNDRYQLIKKNIPNLFQLNQLFIFNQINYLNDIIKRNSILDQYGSLYAHYLVKIPSDTKRIELFFIILTFSTCSDKINFHQHR